MIRHFPGYILLAVVSLIFSLQTAHAQSSLPGLSSQPDAGTATTAPLADPSPNDVRELMRLLSDPEMVEWMRQRAQSTDVATDAENVSLLDQINQGLLGARSRMADLRAAWLALPQAPDVLASSWIQQVPPADMMRSVTYILTFLFIGTGLSWLYWQYASGALGRVEASKPRSLSHNISLSSRRLGLRMGGVATFAMASLGAAMMFDWLPLVGALVFSLLIAVIGLYVVRILVMFVLAPRIAAQRLVPVSNRAAKTLTFWLMILAGALAFGAIILDLADNLSDAFQQPPELRLAALSLSVLVFLLLLALFLIFVWAGLGRINSKPENQDEGPDTETQSQTTSLPLILLSALTVLLFILWLFGLSELMWTLAIAGFFLPSVAIVQHLIDYYFDRAEDEHESETPDDKEETAPVLLSEDGPPPEDNGPQMPTGRYAIHRPVTKRLVRFVMIGLALVLLASAWGVNVFFLGEETSLSGRILLVVFDVIAALLIADLIWVWAKTAIDYRLAGYIPPPSGHQPGPEARMATLLPLLRNMLMVAVFVLVGLTILSSLGVNIAPLIAGAGIVGVAIGFGAQALVKDIVSGIFFLLDDAFRVGEYIEIENLRGTVEGMSIRSLKVRHHRGMVHTIPFGELKSLTNYSRDWVIMKMEFRVPFESDLKRIKKIIKGIGAELLEHPDYGDQIIQTLKSQGVRRMEEFNMVVGVKFMCRPGAQWLIRRDAYQKIRDAFDAAGMAFAQRNVKVEVVGNEGQLTDDQKDQIAGAVQEMTDPQTTPATTPDEP